MSNQTAIARHIEKTGLNLDVQHYTSLLFQYPENTWFAPNNSKDESCTVCDHLASLHIVAKRITPIWSNDSFHGNRLEFFYNKNMEICY